MLVVIAYFGIAFNLEDREVGIRSLVFLEVLDNVVDSLGTAIRTLKTSPELKAYNFICSGLTVLDLLVEGLANGCETVS